MRLSHCFVFVSFAIVSCFAQEATGSRFINVKLAHGITVDLPKSWWLLNGHWNAALETAVEAKMDLAKLDNVLAKQANLIALRSMPEQTFASFRIDYSKSKTNPDGIRNMTKAQLEEFDANLKLLMPKMLAPEKILIWQGTTVETFSGHPATVTHFLRTGSRGPVLVWIRDIALGDGALSLNTSYRATEEELWKPIIERAIRSLKIP